MRRRIPALVAVAAALTVTAPAAAQSPSQAGCDPLDPAVCLQPWPNDFFTRPDASTPTGKRLDLPLLGMPRNAGQLPIRPDEYNRNDGFGPGSPIHTYVPGLDNQAAFERTGLVPITDMACTFDEDQPAWSSTRPRASGSSSGPSSTPTRRPTRTATSTSGPAATG